MYHAVQIISILLVVLALVPALAHVLEFPGKAKLGKEAYFTVQPIYYPGFTVAGGVGEAGGLVSTIVLLLLTPFGTSAFEWTLLAVTGLLGMEVVFWLFTAPVNRVWLQNTNVGNFGAALFSSSSHLPNKDWQKLRDQWERSHLVRAGLVAVSFIALIFAAVFPE